MTVLQACFPTKTAPSRGDHPYRADGNEVAQDMVAATKPFTTAVVGSPDYFADCGFLGPPQSQFVGVRF